jgi:hypothetical protein
MARFLVAAVAALVLLPAAGAVTARPVLSVLQWSPAHVHGTHFKAGEKVGVTLVSGKTKARRNVVVSGKGEFTAVFGGITPLQACGSVVKLVAVGAAGDRSTLSLPTACGTASPTVTTVTPGTTTTTYLAPPPPYTK